MRYNLHFPTVFGFGMRYWNNFFSHLKCLSMKGCKLEQLLLPLPRVRMFTSMVEVYTNRRLKGSVAWSKIIHCSNITRVRQLSDALSRDGHIHLIDENGMNVGLISFGEAKALAEEKGLELCLTRAVSHQHPHALYKLMSKKDIYESKKKKRIQQQKVMKNRQKLKELSLSTDIGEKDMEWKLNRVKEFLLENDKVKLIINQKRRSANECKEFLNKVIDQLKGFGEVDGSIVETEYRFHCTFKPAQEVKSSSK